MFSSIMVGILSLVLTATSAGTTTHDAWRTDLPSLIGESLVAANPDLTPGALRVEAALVRAEVDRLVERLGDGRPTYVRARRLHRVLHRTTLVRYRRDADSLSRLVRAGEYNCLSATLMYGLVARELGYRVIVIERPGHLLLELDLDGRRVEIETTSPDGFNRRPPRPYGDREPGIRLESSLDADSAAVGRQREYPLESLIGFAWLNSAWRDLDAARPARAAKRVERARPFLEWVRDTDDAQRILARAFREEYESGRFDSAYRIARIELTMRPDATTALDRLLAAAVKRIEEACATDRVDDATSVAEELTATVDGAELARFEQRVWPVITAAAVRLARWHLAELAAGHYAAVEPDTIEAVRLVDWVADRRAAEPDGPEDPVCEDRSVRPGASVLRP